MQVDQFHLCALTNSGSRGANYHAHQSNDLVFAMPTSSHHSGSVIGAAMVKDPRVPLISFTGSTAVGRSVSADVHRRFGRTILELGGNNAVIILPDADLELAFQGSIFSAVGTCG